VVGDARTPGCPAAGLVTGTGDVYEASARRWADGPERMYAVLARELLVSSGLRLAGQKKT